MCGNWQRRVLALPMGAGSAWGHVSALRAEATRYKNAGRGELPIRVVSIDSAMRSSPSMCGVGLRKARGQHIDESRAATVPNPPVARPVSTPRCSTYSLGKEHAEHHARMFVVSSQPDWMATLLREPLRLEQNSGQCRLGAGVIDARFDKMLGQRAAVTAQ